MDIAGWCFESSLKDGAKKALNRGTGTYRKYAVHIQTPKDRYIKSLKDDRWYLVVKNNSRPIKAIENR